MLVQDSLNIQIVGRSVSSAQAFVGFDASPCPAITKTGWILLQLKELKILAIENPTSWTDTFFFSSQVGLQADGAGPWNIGCTWWEEAQTGHPSARAFAYENRGYSRETAWGILEPCSQLSGESGYLESVLQGIFSACSVSINHIFPLLSYNL